MKKCPQCGKELDDSVKFCTSCGTPMSAVEPTANSVPPVAENTATQAPNEAASVTSTPTSQPAQPAQPAQPKEKKPVDFTLFDRCFWVLYIVVGALAYLCVELGGIYTNVSVGFTVFLGVLAIILSLGFAAIAVIRKIATMKESEEDRKKHALRDNICLAVSAVMFIFVLIGAIGLFNIADAINELNKALSQLGR